MTVGELTLIAEEQPLETHSEVGQSIGPHSLDVPLVTGQAMVGELEDFSALHFSSAFEVPLSMLLLDYFFALGHGGVRRSSLDLVPFRSICFSWLIVPLGGILLLGWAHSSDGALFVSDSS